MADTEPFFVPLGDEVLLESPGSLKFTDAWVVQGRTALLEVRYRYAYLAEPAPHVFEVDSAARWVEALDGARRPRKRSARELVQVALREGEQVRGRYTLALDLPGWSAPFEPLWLWLSAEEDEQLRRLGIVRAKVCAEDR